MFRFKGVKSKVTANILKDSPPKKAVSLVLNVFSTYFRRLLIPKVKSVMSKPVLTVKADASVMEATELMLTHAVGSVIVSLNDEPLGIFTRRDLINKVLVKKLDVDQTKVLEVMSTPIISISPDDDLERAVELMKRNNVTRLGVLKNGKLVGIVTMTDLKLKFARGYFSLSLVLRRFIIDTLAYATFWSGIWTFVQIFILKFTLFQFVANAIIGFVLTVLFGGIFGRYLDLWRGKFNV
jgi:predicted transcriptional regulator